MSAAVPGAAMAAAWEAFVAAEDRDEDYARVLRAAVTAAAPLIVAAELRRLAERIAGDPRGHEVLRDRASELDPALSNHPGPAVDHHIPPGRGHHSPPQ